MSDQGYNGWTNYPTWAVHLWLTNEPGLYQSALDLAASASDSGARPAPRVELADAFKEWVTYDLCDLDEASVRADLLGYALNQVNWYEIADAFLEIAAGVTA